MKADRDELARRLLATFVDELEVHVAAMNRDLLALEQAGQSEPAGEAERAGSAAQRSQRLHGLFRTVHTVKGASRAAGAASVEAAMHRLEDVLSLMREGELLQGASLFGLLFAVTDALADVGGRLRKGESLAEGSAGGASLDELVARLDEVARGARVSEPVATLTGEATARVADDGRAIRIAKDRLDQLVARSAELLVAQRRLEERLDDVGSLRGVLAARLGGDRPSSYRGGSSTAPDGATARTRDERGDRSALAAFDRFVASLQDERRRIGGEAASLDDLVRRLRMVPFAEACLGLGRAVRDIAVAGSKQIDVDIRGGDVELDRAVLDGLRDPLLHLVRNAADHGVETPDERAAQGKTPRATITVSASLRGAEIVIAVEDDGRGIDLAAVRGQLRRRGLREPAGDEDAASAIFAPGISTARLITDVSGRGVGLDAVKRAVEAMRGTVDLSFRRGEGSRFAMVVPLTLTSVRGLLVKAGGQTFILPGAYVWRLLRAGPSDLGRMAGVEAVVVDGSPIPLVALSELLGRPARPRLSAGRVPVVVVVAHGARVGLAVDELVAERDVVVKSLGPRLRGAKAASGAKVLPDGRLALILNVPELVARARDRAGQGSLLTSVVSDPVRSTPPRKILVADDSLTTRTLERSILEAAGYIVDAVADGEQAWNHLQEHEVDLVVSDVEMPMLDGFALTERVRASPRFRHLPVVLVTARASDADKARGLAVGASAYVIKSAFDQTSLLETLAQLL